MEKRRTIAIGMAAGAVWSVVVVVLAAVFVKLPVFGLIPIIMTAFMAPGMVMIAMVGRLAQRRFFDDATIDGGPLTGAAEIDQRVLQNTTEQLVLALAVWPAAAVMLGTYGPGVIIVLGVSFAISRVAFWWGYHRAPRLRAYGFAATFYPTVLVAVWAMVRTVT